jgi:pyridoxal phosphate-dependent aminotransferase EpsN
VLAGIGLGQLDVLDARVHRRREIFQCYKKGLMDTEGFSFQEDSANSFGCRWLTVVQCDPDAISLHPYQIMRELNRVGVETRPAWKPMHMQPLCRNFEFVPHTEQDIVSASLFLRSLCLPSGSVMSEAEVERVVNSIKHIISRS